RRRRDRQETGFSLTGDEPGGQHAAFQDFGIGGRGAEDYGSWPGNEVGNRKIARASAEPRMSPQEPIVYIISAPSGSGKSTLVNEVLKLVPNLDFSISYTTRDPRG